MDRMVRIAMMSQVTTTDSDMGRPPKTGMVNAVLQFNSSSRFSARSPVVLTPFLR